MSTIMEPKKVKSGRGRGRGVLALTSYEPCPRPGAATIGSWHQSKRKLDRNTVTSKANSNSVTNPPDNSVENIGRIRTNNGNINGNNRNVEHLQTNHNENNRNVEHVGTNHNGNNRNGYRDDSHSANTNELKKQDIRHNTSNIGRVANSQHDLNMETGESKGGIKLDKCEADILAKYNYKANPNKAGGFDELTIKQGEKLMLIRKGHEETNNNLWWEVRNARGEQGFVPGTFCMVLEQSPSSLPWLENKRMLDEKEKRKEEESVIDNNIDCADTGFGNPNNGTRPVKQYQSAYDSAPATNVAEANKEFFCEVCDKNLNGPIPYKSHMSSKAHREEVEYHRSKDKYN